MEEIWKPVVGYEDLYSVSNHGQIRVNNNGRGRTRKGLILKTFKSNCGYWRVTLSKNSHKTTHSVHKIVAISFLGEIPNGLQINHKDGSKENNYSYNLEYISPILNIEHAYTYGLRKRGEGLSVSKLNNKKVIEIRKKYSEGLSLRELAMIYDVDYTNISCIINNKTWKNVKSEELCLTK